MTFQDPDTRLVLASVSPARAAILAAAGLVFETAPAVVDEAGVKQAAQAEGATPDDVAVLLADMKARRIALTRPEALVIGADQMLVCDDIWFDKPADLAAARGQLVALRGRAHTLVTAVVCHRGARVWQHVSRPRLAMRDVSDDFLDRYIAAEGKALLGCVGAYRLEGPGIHLFRQVEGEHAAILGLPMLPLLEFLRGHGVLAR